MFFLSVLTAALALCTHMQLTVVPAKWRAWGMQRYGASPRRVDALQHYRCLPLLLGGRGMETGLLK